jgi:hypothetical protein
MHPSRSMSLHQILLDAYWHERHNNCTLQAECRAMCALLALADAVVPDDVQPVSAEACAWAERRRIRQEILGGID